MFMGLRSEDLGGPTRRLLRSQVPSVGIAPDHWSGGLACAAPALKVCRHFQPRTRPWQAWVCSRVGSSEAGNATRTGRETTGQIDGTHVYEMLSPFSFSGQCAACPPLIAAFDLAGVSSSESKQLWEFDSLQNCGRGKNARPRGPMALRENGFRIEH